MAMGRTQPESISLDSLQTVEEAEMAGNVNRIESSRVNYSARAALLGLAADSRVK